MRQTFNLIFLSCLMKNLFERAFFTLDGQTCLCRTFPKVGLLCPTNCPCCRHSGRVWRWGCDDRKDPSSFWSCLSPVERFFWVGYESFANLSASNSTWEVFSWNICHRSGPSVLNSWVCEWNIIWTGLRDRCMLWLPLFGKISLTTRHCLVVLDIRAAHDMPLC